jgi:hypothetical protein
MKCNKFLIPPQKFLMPLKIFDALKNLTYVNEHIRSYMFGTRVLKIQMENDESNDGSQWEYPTFSSFDDILHYYSKILDGSIDGDTVSSGSLADETVPLLPCLTKMNNASILTVDSQLGLIKRECIFDERLTTLKQRAFVDCFMRPETFARLLSRGFNMNGIVCVVTAPCGRETKERLSRDDDHISVTVEEDENQQEDKSLENHTIITTISLEMSTNDLDYLLDDNVRSKVLSGIIHVTFIDLDWGRPMYLFDMILRCL